MSVQAAPDDPEGAARRADLLVVGAGAMGGWSAYFAQAGGGGPDGRTGGGRAVTLVDAWGPGNPRASSGDATRISRASHGADRLYTRWSRRARELWLRYGAEWGIDLFLSAGVLWFAHRPDGFEADSAATLAALGVPHTRLTPDALVRMWPQTGPADDLDHALYEPEAGVLRAQAACQAVVTAFRRHGGRYAVAEVVPGRSAGGRLLDVVDREGRRWSAETFLFAAGPWLPRLFPELLAETIHVTRQEVLFFGPPGGDPGYGWRALPAWCDHDAAWYGIGATDAWGVKVAPDGYGPPFDPTHGERIADPETARAARDILRRRLPGLAGEPVTGARVCQYETTPDGHFLLAPHPGYTNVWLAGGGSGHGFKHGPRIGEYLVGRIDGAPEGASDGADEARFRVGPRTPGSAPRGGGGPVPGADGGGATPR